MEAYLSPLRPILLLFFLVGAQWGCAISHPMAAISPCGVPPESAEIIWYGPSEPKDRRANEARCRTVGAPVVMESPSVDIGPLEEGDSLAVVSWNVAVGGGDLLSFLGEGLGVTCSREDTGGSGAFPHFVLLLQEASRRAPDLPPLDDWNYCRSPNSRRHDLPPWLRITSSSRIFST